MIMGEKINVAELLKDCPKGMELDCMMYENVELDFIEQNPESIYPIHCLLKLNGGCNTLVFTHNGCSDRHPNAKCVIFPKGKTTWKGFVPPCEFKAGDVLVSRSGNIVLLSHINSENIVHYHCIIPNCGNFRIEENTSIGVGKYYQCDLANEQQRQRMYDRIKCSGYKYNQHINKLEKLVEPKFKVGDDIRIKGTSAIYVVTEIREDRYMLDDKDISLLFKKQDEWELVPNKFDINTLMPFDKVLVRDENLLEDSDITDATWSAALYSHNKFVDNVCPYVTTNGHFAQCVPYKGNEHLLGTTDDCDEYYKTWE